MLQFAEYLATQQIGRATPCRSLCVFAFVFVLGGARAAAPSQRPLLAAPARQTKRRRIPSLQTALGSRAPPTSSLRILPSTSSLTPKPSLAVPQRAWARARVAAEPTDVYWRHVGRIFDQVGG